MKTYTCEICRNKFDKKEMVLDTSCVNPENEQKIIYGVSLCLGCSQDDQILRHFAATSQYYDWTSEASEYLDKAKECESEEELQDILQDMADNAHDKFKNHTLASADVDGCIQDLQESMTSAYNILH